MAIDERQEVRFGDTTQWVRVRGVDASNPVLLLIQQGPGLPMMNEARRFEDLLGLEQDFTVVYWDQRGCGRSLRRPEEPTGISIDAMVSDTVAILEWLRDRYEREVFVIGFSFGGAIGAFAAAGRPDLVEALVVVGMDIDGVAAGTAAYDFALRTAHERGKRRAIRQLEAIGPPPHLKLKQFSTRVHWASNFGGVTIRTIRGMGATQMALLSDLSRMDLNRSVTRLEVPVVMAQGRLDQVAPGEEAERFSSSLRGTQ